eukprot:4460539-Amphidinium_carterae.1
MTVSVPAASCNRRPRLKLNLCSPCKKRTHLTRAAVEQVVSAEEVLGTGQADRPTNLGTAEHAPLEPATSWTYWADFGTKVFHFWRLVRPLLRECPKSELRVRLPHEVPKETPELRIIGMVFPEAPFFIGPHLRVA